jgi:tyrosine phenol-lyase
VPKSKKTIFEPFKIKTIEPIKISSKQQRKEFIKKANYNLFDLKSEDVIIDLLTDSGTSAMSAQQWSALIKGDESYAGSSSFYVFRDTIEKLMPFKHIIPTHQGRAAEKILSSILCNKNTPSYIPNNTHFDTTRANFEYNNIVALDFVSEVSKDTQLKHPFKGNMDIDKLDSFLKVHHKNTPLVMTTITNNAGGGQPVSLENIKMTKDICLKYKIPFFIDACRFAENAYFIKLREKKYQSYSVREIVKEIFSYADGMTMSAKKDAFANIGGWLALNDDIWAQQARDLLILTEGFTTYGGLSGRDLEAIAVGLEEILVEDYLEYRIKSTKFLADKLSEIGIPVVQPAGGHAVFVDAKMLLPHIPALNYPGQALAVALYEEGGVRSCEIGSVMFGRQADGREIPCSMELVRMAIPRRVYTQSHIEYVVECFEQIFLHRKKIKGFKISYEPKSLRHFSAKFIPCESIQNNFNSATL